jgi:hypothetical protein
VKHLLGECCFRVEQSSGPVALVGQQEQVCQRESEQDPVPERRVRRLRTGIGKRGLHHCDSFVHTTISAESRGGDDGLRKRWAVRFCRHLMA